MSDAFKKFDLTGKTAVVTGGATGLGYYMTRGLMRSGAKVLIAARRENVLAEAAEKLRAESTAGEILYKTLDLNDRSSIEAFASHATEVLNGVDIFIGNAAQEGLEKIDDITDDNLDFMVQVNLLSNIQLTRAFLPNMRARKWGRIMYSSSVNSVKGTPHEGASVYAATKGGLNAFARVAATEAGHDGITVNSLLLGMYHTEMVQAMVEGFDQQNGAGAGKQLLESFSSMMPAGRLGKVEEVEGMIQYLASDAGSYVSGSDFYIDGGLSIMMRPNTPPTEPVIPSLD
jgi:gluconate 5-dehydrogenase